MHLLTSRVWFFLLPLTTANPVLALIALELSAGLINSTIISVSLSWGASLGSTLVYLCELAYIYWNCTSCTPLNFLGGCHCEILAVVFGSEYILSLHLMAPVFWQTCYSVIQLMSCASWSSKLTCFTVHEYYFFKVKFLFCLSALLFRLFTCSRWTAAEHWNEHSVLWQPLSWAALAAALKVLFYKFLPFLKLNSHVLKK